jgi:hypothetical protein
MNLEAIVERVVQTGDFKKNPSRFLEDVAGGTLITIAEGRKAHAMLVSRETWIRLVVRLQKLEDELETRELLADPKVQQRVKEGLPSRGVPLHEARPQLRSRPDRR